MLPYLFIIIIFALGVSQPLFFISFFRYFLWNKTRMSISQWLYIFFSFSPYVISEYYAGLVFFVSFNVFLSHESRL